MRSHYVGSLAATNANIEVGAIRGPNVSVIACVTKDRMVYHEANTHSTNAQIFSSFLMNLFALIPERNAVFVLDNARIHKTREVIALFRTQGRRVVFLPPYSPQLNMIETVFSKWKHIVRRMACQNTAELLVRIPQAAQQVTQSDLNGYFRKMIRYVTLAISNQPYWS